MTPVSAVETVDFTKLKDISELWSSASVPNDTYNSATHRSRLHRPPIFPSWSMACRKKRRWWIPAGKAVTTQTINITFDPQHQPIIQPTLSSSSALRLAINFDLAASNVVNLATNPADRDDQARS